MSNTNRRSYARPQDPELANAIAYLQKHPTRYLFPTVNGDERRPSFYDNLNQASNDPEQLKRWYAEHRERGPIHWACATKKSGLVCVDSDEGEGKNGRQSREALKAAGFTLPRTELARTPSGGLHALYLGEHHFSTNKIGKGVVGVPIPSNIDTPNYFMIPGSVRSDGKRYEVTPGSAPIATLPQWIADAIKPRSTERRNYTGDAIPLDVFQKMLNATPYTGGPTGLDNRHDYEGWLTFAMEAHEAAGGDEGDYLEAFIQWCTDDPHAKDTWTRERIERHWQSFTADPPEGSAARTRGSWFKLLEHIGHPEFVGEQYTPAMDFGDDPEPDWSNVVQHPSVNADVIAAWHQTHRKKREEKAKAKTEQQEQRENGGKDQKQRRNRLKGRTFDELEKLKDPEWVVLNMIPDNGLTVIYGKPKRGKSFYALHLSLCMASGVAFFGEPIGRTGRVLYIAAEGGASAVRNRVRAWLKAHKIGADKIIPNFVLVDTGIALNAPESVKDFLAANPGEFAMVIVDTLARNTRGDENSAKDMSAAIKGCDMIREATHGGLILVHHEGWSAKRIRGSSVLLGAPDAVIRVSRDKGDVTTVIAEDMRESAAGKRQDFTLGSDGVLHILTAAESTAQRTGDKVLGILADLQDDNEGKPVPVMMWRSAVKAAGLIDEGVTGRSQWKRWLDAAVKAKRVKRHKGETYSLIVKRDDLADDAPTFDETEPSQDME